MLFRHENTNKILEFCFLVLKKNVIHFEALN